MNIHMGANGKKCLPKDCLLIHVSTESLFAQQNNHSCSDTSTCMHCTIWSTVASIHTSSFSMQETLNFAQSVYMCVLYGCQNKYWSISYIVLIPCLCNGDAVCILWGRPEYLNTTYPLINLAGRCAVQQWNITLKCNSEGLIFLSIDVYMLTLKGSINLSWPYNGQAWPQ